MKVNSDERKRIYAIVEALNSDINDAEGKRAKAEKKIDPKHNKLEGLDRAIRDLERNMQVTSSSAKQEKECIRQMNFIKESRPYIEEVDRLMAIIKERKNAKYEVSKGLKDLKEEANKLKARIRELKKDQTDVLETKE
jgi:chromosome segregation ATPase